MLLTTHLLLGMPCGRPMVMMMLCSTSTCAFKPVCMNTLFETTCLLLGLHKRSAPGDDVGSTPIYVFEPVCLSRLLKTTRLLLGLYIWSARGDDDMSHTHMCVLSCLTASTRFCRPYISCWTSILSTQGDEDESPHTSSNLLSGNRFRIIPQECGSLCPSPFPSHRYSTGLFAGRLKSNENF